MLVRHVQPTGGFAMNLLFAPYAMHKRTCNPLCDRHNTRESSIAMPRYRHRLLCRLGVSGN
jgi:hypothetical protein